MGKLTDFCVIAEHILILTVNYDKIADVCTLITISSGNVVYDFEEIYHRLIKRENL